MSQLAVGHPDFQEYATWRGPSLFSGAVTVTSVAPKTIQGYVTAYASAYVTVAQTSGVGCTVKLQFFTDATKTTQVGPDENYVLNNNNSINVIVPLLGNYFVVTITTGQAGNQVLAVGVTLSNVQAPAKRWPVSGNRITQTAAVIGAGGQLTAQIPQIMEGDGFMSISKSTATADSNAYIQEQTEGAAANGRIVTLSPLGSVQSSVFQAGANPLQFVINNTSAGSLTFIYWVSIVGR